MWYEWLTKPNPDKDNIGGIAGVLFAVFCVLCFALGLANLILRSLTW